LQDLNLDKEKEFYFFSTKKCWAYVYLVCLFTTIEPNHAQRKTCCRIVQWELHRQIHNLKSVRKLCPSQQLDAQVGHCAGK